MYQTAMFAGDVSLFCSHPCKLTAQAAMQEAVTRVEEWSSYHKMTLNAEKCEVTCFTSNLHEARWQQTIYLEGQPIRLIPLPKLLGVTLDRAFSFGLHVANIATKSASRRHALTSLTSKNWGWRKDQLT